MRFGTIGSILNETMRKGNGGSLCRAERKTAEDPDGDPIQAEHGCFFVVALGLHCLKKGIRASILFLTA